MQKTLEKLRVIQKIEFVDRNRTRQKERLNPYNPLSYLYIVVSIPIYIISVGWHELRENWNNPFKYQ